MAPSFPPLQKNPLCVYRLLKDNKTKDVFKTGGGIAPFVNECLFVARRSGYLGIGSLATRVSDRVHCWLYTMPLT